MTHSSGPPIEVLPPEPTRTQAARDQFELFRSILDSTGDGIVVADEHGRFLLFNPAAEQILGLGSSEVPPALWAQTYGVYYPDGKTLYPSEQMPLARAIRGEESNQIELYIRNRARPEGVYISATGRPLRDQYGQLCGGVVVFRDITEKKQTEQRLLYKQHLLHALMAPMPDCIYFKDCDSRFTRLNRAVATRFGLAHPQEASGKTDSDFFLDEHACQAIHDEREVMRTLEPIIGQEEKETWPDGRVTWVSTTKLPLFDEAGGLIGTFGISHNIT